MPVDDSRDTPKERARPGVEDASLIVGVRQGEERALRTLMDQYDRLVRYTIFLGAKTPCQRDPQWLDGVASATWSGFVQSIRTGSGLSGGRLSAYLVRIARNQTVSALRRQRPDQASGGDEPAIPIDPIDGEDDEPTAILTRLEQLEVLRNSLGELAEDDRTLLTQSEAILDRRWLEAAQALGMAESTLRSRWKRLLGRLRRCLDRNCQDSVAPSLLRRD